MKKVQKKKSSKSLQWWELVIRSLSKKEIDILNILIQNEPGLRAKTISNLTKIRTRNLYKKLNKLKEKKIITSIFPSWKLTNEYFALFQGKSLNSSKLLKSNKPIEIHDFTFVIRLIKKPDWWERRNNRLKKYGFRNIVWGNNTYNQKEIKKYVLQFFSNSIIIMLKDRYYGNDPYECFVQATDDLLKIYKDIEKEYKFRFFEDGIPQLSIRSHHYVKLRDSIAQNCKETGNKFEININGITRLWVDMSEPLGMEAGSRNHAPEDMRQYKKYVTDFVINNPPTNTELSHNIQGIPKKLTEINQNQLFLTKSIKGMAEQNNRLFEGLDKLTEVTLLEIKNKKLHEAVLRDIRKYIGILVNIKEKKVKKLTNQSLLTDY